MTLFGLETLLDVLGKSQLNAKAERRLRNDVEAARKRFVEAPTPFVEVARAISQIATNLHLLIRYRERVAKGFGARREREKSVLRQMVKEGWFIHPLLLPFLPQIDSFLEEDSDEIQRIMGHFFSAQANDIEKQLKESYFNRSQIFEEAFEAHREAKYCLSVPVLLAQCDGLVHDQFGKSLFMLQERKTVVEEINRTTPDILRLFADPDTWEEMSLWLAKHQRSEHLNDLNRHKVLHGECTDYNTETNSLRVISLINYIHCVIVEYKTFASNEMGLPFQLG